MKSVFDDPEVLKEYVELVKELDSPWFKPRPGTKQEDVGEYGKFIDDYFIPNYKFLFEVWYNGNPFWSPTKLWAPHPQKVGWLEWYEDHHRIKPLGETEFVEIAIVKVYLSLKGIHSSELERRLG